MLGAAGAATRSVALTSAPVGNRIVGSASIAGRDRGPRGPDARRRVRATRGRQNDVGRTRERVPRANRGLQSEGQRVHHGPARSGAGAGESPRRRAARGAGPRSAARNSDRAQGQHRHRGRAHDGRERGLRRSRADRGRRGGAPARRGGRHRHRQSQPPRVRVRRHVRDELLRTSPQSVGARAQSGRILGRLGGRGLDQHVLRRARYRYRRLHPHTLVVLQRRRAQADVRPGLHPRNHSADAVARPLRADHPQRRWTPRSC